MNCGEFDKIVHELDRLSQTGGAGGQSPASEAALAHAESCSRCAKLLTEVEALNFGLRAIAQHDSQQEAPARLEASLLHAFQDRAAKQRGPAVPHATTAGFKTYGWYAAALAAAAIVLLVLGLVRGWIGTGVRALAPNQVGVAQATADTKKPLTIGHPVVSTAAPQPAQSASASDDASAFYALPYADDPTSLDGGAVIRVSVPRSELAGWGLPISGVGGAGPIPADLLVSADGTPQAIRLVSQPNE